MINAVINKKADIQLNEDVKTSCVFGLLTLLPAELFWKLLRSSISDGQTLPKSSGDILNVDFWPRWDVDDNDTDVTNERFVEPDVFVEFENLDLIIEVKMDGNSQKESQWINEVCAYKTYKGNDKTLVFIALGGNDSIDTYRLTKGKSKNALVYKCGWNKLLEAIHSEAEYLEQATFQYDSHVLRTLRKIEESFVIYGERVTLWLESIPENLTCINSNRLYEINEVWKQLK